MVAASLKKCDHRLKTRLYLPLLISVIMDHTVFICPHVLSVEKFVSNGIFMSHLSCEA